jgi:hypothetical protein
MAARFLEHAIYDTRNHADTATSSRTVAVGGK